MSGHDIVGCIFYLCCILSFTNKETPIITNTPPIIQKLSVNCCKKGNGTPAIINPEFTTRSLLEMHPFLIYRIAAITSNITATVHTGIATSVRNANGIPTTVIPKMLKNPTNARHTLWHACHEPRMLAIPETLPVAPITFSFMFLTIFNTSNQFEPNSVYCTRGFAPRHLSACNAQADRCNGSTQPFSRHCGKKTCASALRTISSTWPEYPLLSRM
jgi:hypothetical protein